MSNPELPWQDVGYSIDGMSSSRAISTAKLNWTVEQVPLYTKNSKGQILEIDDKLCNIRTDNNESLGIVSAGYNVYQNIDCFNLLDELIEEGIIKYDTAGVINNGRKIWILAKTVKEITVVEGDVIKPYVLLANSHDGSSALRLIPTTVRVLCTNILNLALKSSDKSEGSIIYHQTNILERVQRIKLKFNMLLNRFETFADEVRGMAYNKLTKDQLKQYYLNSTEEYEDSPQRNKIIHRFYENLEDSSNTISKIRGTVWAAYNSVSQYADHNMMARRSRVDDDSSNHLNNIWFGPSNALKQKAYKEAINCIK